MVESTDIKGKAEEVLKTFSLVFLRNCGCALLDDVQEEVRKRKEGQKEAAWKLSKKKGDSKKNEGGLYKGELWMRSGEGAGDFSKWQKVYVVQEETYHITVYKNQKSLEEGKKPLARIQPAGYELTTDVKDHYKNDIKNLIKDVREVDAESLTADIEPFSWALTHPNRTNYMFLARPNKLKSKSMISGLCNCSKKVEPETVAEELEEERELREAATDFMRTCIECAQPREKKSIEGRAFELTVSQLPGELEQLGDDWTDDGTEAEILVDVLMEVCLQEQRDEVFSRPAPLSLQVSAWYKVRMSVYKVVSPMVEETWSAAIAGISKLRTELEPTIRTGLEPIVAFKMTIESKINDAVLDKLGSLLAENVTPFIKPLLEFYENPLRDSLTAGRQFLEEKLSSESLPGKSAEREAYLKELLNNGEDRESLYRSLGSMATALTTIQAINPTGKKVFSGAGISRMRLNVQHAVDEILDAAIYTYIIRLNPSAYKDVNESSSKGDNKGVTNEGLAPDTAGELKTDVDPVEILRQVLKDFDHDIQIVRSEFIKEAVHSLLLEAFHKLSDPVIKPITRQINQSIPENFAKYLSLEKVLDEIINRFIWKPVEQMVEAAYPLPSDN